MTITAPAIDRIAVSGVDVPRQLFTGLLLVPAPSPAVFSAPRNTERGLFHKPEGGLWTSSYAGPAIGSDWEQWRIAESWGDAKVSPWLLTPAPSARVLKIDGMADFTTFHAAYRRQDWTRDYRYMTALDFERMAADGIDAIWLTERGQHETRFTDPGLYGWDVECVLWLRWAFVGEPELVPVTWWSDEAD